MYLRAYRNSDLEALYAMDVRCFPPRFRFSRAMMRQVVEAPAARVTLACEREGDRERLVGFCAATLEPSSEGLTAYLATIDVAPERRGEGHGATLLHWAEKACEEAGAGELALHVWVENQAAIRLYGRMNYGRVRRELDFYGPGFDAWLFSKRLGNARMPGA